MRTERLIHLALVFILFVRAGGAAGAPGSGGAAAPAEIKPFIQKYCLECHDPDLKKGDLGLTALSFDLDKPADFAKWVLVHDRVSAGEMPPKKKKRPDAKDEAAFARFLSSALTSADDLRDRREGRATQRRLNRYEYENALRDLLGAPWLRIRDALPEDGEAARFNKIGDALDVSHVQMARYLSVADDALRQVIAAQVERPPTEVVRYYTRDQRSFTGKMKFSVFNVRPERATFPVVGSKGQPEVRSGKAPISDPKLREEEAVGVVAGTYEPLEITFNRFRAPVSGHYKLRFKTYSVWVGPGKGKKWYIPDLDNVSPGHRDEPVTIYSETPPRLLRRLGAFDAKVAPEVAELDVQLLAGETIWPDASRLFRSRPNNWINPLAEADGCPGVAFAWMEVEGPIYDQWPTAGHRLMFGDLPIEDDPAAPPTPSQKRNLSRLRGGAPAGSAALLTHVRVISGHPREDAARLLRGFLNRAYREPVADGDVGRFMKVFDAATASGSAFADAMISTYTAVLCSPRFVCLEEKPGPLDDFALASRLSFFLWNSPPDETLRQLAASGKLHEPAVLRGQTDRMLADGRSRRFIDAFLDYWLDLRKITATAPDGALYNDYYLDDLLEESALAETRLFFTELVKDDLPARNIVSSEFTMLNERLAAHYGIAGVKGVAMRRVKLPAESVRGGLMTQASVLKVTANGTTTSPVIRGAWIMERILGKPPAPPPPNLPTIEPDTRGATTIRQQLEKHRTMATCNACHAKIDPAGFALENFDVMGGWRERYRALGPGGPPVKGIGKNGQKFAFHLGLPVDASGELPGGGGKFKNVRELKTLLLKDERQIARNLAEQLVVYATGARIRFGDREKIERILDRCGPGHGVKRMIEEIVQSDLFLRK